MITRDQVCKAIQTLRGEVHPDPKDILRQLALSLKLYQFREEWDGSVESAIECLMGAGYEIDAARNPGEPND